MVNGAKNVRMSIIMFVFVGSLGPYIPCIMSLGAGRLYIIAGWLRVGLYNRSKMSDQATYKEAAKLCIAGNFGVEPTDDK